MTRNSLDGDLDVSVGDAVSLVLKVTNAGEGPMELRFRSGLAADFAVRQAGAEVWRFSAGRMFTQALWSERLAPGETASYDATWESPEPGAYEVVATLKASNADVEARASFEV